LQERHSGEKILHYRILEKLGKGGMGEVFKAEDTKLGRLVAIKFLSPEWIRNEHAKKRFLREAQSASGLNHSGIVTIYSIEQTKNLFFIVMEYVMGETLRQKITRGPLSLAEVLDIGIQTAEALDSAHSSGVIHRDIKPANIIITPSGQTKVLDFGLVKLTDLASNETQTVITESGVAVGTIHYMSPEQCLGDVVDLRSDIFSLGCVLYEAATGKQAFPGPNYLTVLNYIANQDPTPPRKINKNIPIKLQQILLKALSKKKEDRYPSAGAMAEDLRKIQDLSSGSIRAMEMIPQTQYARSGDISIAYQVIGDGPVDLIFVSGWVSHVEHAWENPLVARFYNRLASFSRLILFDKRGTGLSDQTADLPDLTQRMDDVRAVMDAVGSQKAVLFGMSEGGSMCMLFAATYPERTVALITFGVFAKRIWDPEYPWAPHPEDRQKNFLDLIERDWGRGVVDLEVLAPSRAHDEDFRKWWGRYLRLSASPRAAVALAKMNTPIDVRNVLPVIAVPTLVMHRTGDRDAKVAEGHYISEKIPGAKFVEFSGEDHLVWVGDQESVLEEIERFIAAVQPAPEAERILTTVLTMQIADESQSLDSVSGLLLRETEKYRGEELDYQSGSYIATFDGPARAMICASVLCDALSRQGLKIRAGLHTGECEIIGGKPSGFALKLSRQIAEEAKATEVLVSQTVKDLVTGSNFQFVDRGIGLFPEIPGEWRLYSIQPGTRIP